jgi:PAS domain S-box-containing protein
MTRVRLWCAQDGNVNEWNNMAADITRYSKEEVIGRSLVQEFIADEFKESVESVLQRALKGRGSAYFELKLCTKSTSNNVGHHAEQQYVDVLLNATTRRDARGKIVGVVGVGQDITERKAAQVRPSIVPTGKVANCESGLAREVALERRTNPKISRRACSPPYGLQSWRGRSAGVANGLHPNRNLSIVLLAAPPARGPHGLCEAVVSHRQSHTQPSVSLPSAG